MLGSPGVNVHRGLSVSIGNGELLVPVLWSVALAVSPVVGHGHAGDWGREAVVVRLAVLQYVSRSHSPAFIGSRQLGVLGGPGEGPSGPEQGEETVEVADGGDKQR